MKQQTALTLDGPHDALAAFEAGFDLLHGGHGCPTALFQTDPDLAEGSPWRLTIYVAAAEADEWYDRIVLMARERGLSDDVERTDFSETDWVAQTLRDLAPVRAGRLVVHGSHDRDAARTGEIAVEIDAGLAFGTGHHGTTSGCLCMLDRTLRRARPRRVMDIGTGSAVLAIAAAKAARVPVLATDIDPVATRVARENAKLNGVAPLVRCETAAGFASPVFDAFGPCDLLIANILAGPLKRLARPMLRHLVPGATVVLSGLLPHQRAAIVSAYRLQGLRLERAHVENGWLTLAMRR